MKKLLELIAEISPLIDKYGAPLLASVLSILGSKTAPTQEQWDVLLKDTSTTARDQMLATLAAHGIDPASPAGLALLALVA